MRPLRTLRHATEDVRTIFEEAPCEHVIDCGGGWSVEVDPRFRGAVLRRVSESGSENFEEEVVWLTDEEVRVFASLLRSATLGKVHDALEAWHKKDVEEVKLLAATPPEVRFSW